ncbi:DUF4259 domain-containing protein [Rubripirellula amarantea]|uniref:DUF4259 domain-containing protein n=1 Tax=Rubripirellula amarantea TaxID=2527999 RepID=A0A5C5WJJ9_9BACT|nr:DUF4259 domain-containing protein [Rubripirellula amarantea]MDA8746421.1 DUF4259 domain-containing protein [Rubripirellula amarantea]TWT50295.1 hypothetical protein Pla22_30360 [Rubripirellula amarantea]
MSTWGPRTFEDDFACDWLEDLEDSDPISFFTHCLDLSDQDALNFVACVGVLGTSELIHGVLAEPREKMPEQALSWIENHENLADELKALVPAAIAGIDRVLKTSSAMRMRWQDAGEIHHSTWIGEVLELQNGLKAI